MRHRVLPALVGTALAYHSAKCTNLCGVNGSTGHGCCRKGAHLGAIDVTRHAFRYHLNVIFHEARSSAVVASGGACAAGGNARLLKWVRHWMFLSWLRQICRCAPARQNTAEARFIIQPRLKTDVMGLPCFL